MHNPLLLNGLFIAQLACTLFMTGVIWIVQVVHYPLFAGVGVDEFSTYARQHQTRISFVVMPPMLVELGCALLFIPLRPALVPAFAAWLGLVLVLAIWLVTFLLSVPQHSALGLGFDSAAHRLLVQTNWIRTAAWSARSLLLLWLLARLLR